MFSADDIILCKADCHSLSAGPYNPIIINIMGFFKSKDKSKPVSFTNQQYKTQIAFYPQTVTHHQPLVIRAYRSRSIEFRDMFKKF